MKFGRNVKQNDVISNYDLEAKQMSLNIIK